MYIGIDIGGTFIKLGAFTSAGVFVAQRSLNTIVLDQQGCDNVVAVIEDMTGAEGIEGIGVGIPGTVDSAGNISMIPNATVDTRAFIDAAQKAFPQALPVFCNDANAAALGEQWLGAARGSTSMVLITIGTGIGAGIVVDGKPYTGGHGAAGEVGHLCVVPHGRPCNCGGHGCLEQYASAKALVAIANERAEKLGDNCAPFYGAKEVFEQEREGCEAARFAIDTFTDMLGFSLAQIACVVDPELFLIGGGPSASFEQFATRLRNAYQNAAIGPCRHIAIEAACLGNQAGIAGAARLAMLA